MQREQMRSGKRILIWPAYLDSGLTRSQGRLTRAEHSVRAPKAAEIRRAAENLGLHPEVESDRAHPSRPFDRTGRVTIDNAGPKSALLDKIGAEVIRLRGGRQ